MTIARGKYHLCAGSAGQNADFAGDSLLNTKIVPHLFMLSWSNIQIPLYSVLFVVFLPSPPSTPFTCASRLFSVNPWPAERRIKMKLKDQAILQPTYVFSI